MNIAVEMQSARENESTCEFEWLLLLLLQNGTQIDYKHSKSMRISSMKERKKSREIEREWGINRENKIEIRYSWRPAILKHNTKLHMYNQRMRWSKPPISYGNTNTEWMFIHHHCITHIHRYTGQTHSLGRFVVFWFYFNLYFISNGWLRVPFTVRSGLSIHWMSW